MSKSSSQVWGHHLSKGPAEANIAFCAGRDVQSIAMADEGLLPYDIWTNRAHVRMLYEEGIIDQPTCTAIFEGLQVLESLIEEGQFSLDPKKEDVHMNVEAFIIEKYGIEVGGWMHTGRSRNDQSACDVRLYLREQILALSSSTQKLVNSLLDQAKAHANTAMPGFTHYQPGMVTSWGHWLCSYAQSLCRDLERMEFSYQLINRSPLGAAASFGTSWPINRERAAELLAFDRVDENTLDCIVSRWENETQVTQNFAFLMNHLSIIAQDLIFLSLPFTKMLTIDDAFVTGSSIMPQKRNPDFAEVLKAKASLVHGSLTSLLGIQKGGLSGYNRDTQWSKYLVMDVIRECHDAPELLSHVFSSIKVHTEQMEAHCQVGFMNSVDLADYLAREYQLSFRECYHILALTVKKAKVVGSITHEVLTEALEELEYSVQVPQADFEQFQSPQLLLEQRQHTGAPSAESVLAQVSCFRKRIEAHAQFVDQKQKQLQQAKQQCHVISS